MRTAVERLQQAIVPTGIERLHLDEYTELAVDRVQRLRERRDRLAVRQAHRLQLVGTHLGNVQATDGAVVMHDQLAVGGGMHVQLHRVGALRRCGPKRGERILHRGAGGAAVRDDQRFHCCRLSAFFASIQSGSFSMSCTVALSSGRGSTDAR